MNVRLRNNLPKPLTNFVGREREISEVKTALAKNRLLTLTGVGGCGKTRLAQEVATAISEQLGEEVWFVPLAPICDSDFIPTAVISALRLPEERKPTALERLVEDFSMRQSLLVWDNCEHLIEACAVLVERLLHACPNLTILATSREPLRLSGEAIWRDPPLSFPDLQEPSLKEKLFEYDSVQLFIARAGVAAPSFSINEQNADVVARICSRVEGIPLAIELAASRLRMLPIEYIDSRLEDRFRLLTGGSRTAMSRQQTLRATIDWSYNLLSGPEQILFGRLSVFIGGWTLQAAEAVCSGEEIAGSDVFELMSELLDKSLCERQDNKSRYRMLETLRQYAVQKLAEPVAQAIASRHAEWFAKLVQEAEVHFAGPDEVLWPDRLDADIENLRAALSWNSQTNPDTGLRMATKLSRFWQTRGHYEEARKWLSSLLASDPRPSHAPDRAKALIALGDCEVFRLGRRSAEQYYSEALSLSQDLGDTRGIADAFARLASVAHDLGEYSKAQELSQESLAIQRRLGNRLGIATSLNALALVAHHQGNYPIAHSISTEELQIHSSLGNKRGMSITLIRLGSVALRQGDLASARRCFEESLELAKSMHDEASIRAALANLGRVAAWEGDYVYARKVFSESLIWHEKLGRKNVIPELLSLGFITTEMGDLDKAHLLFNRSLDLSREIGEKRSIASSLSALAYLAMQQRDFSLARSLSEESLSISRQLGDKVSVADCLWVSALWPVGRRTTQRHGRCCTRVCGSVQN